MIVRVFTLFFAANLLALSSCATGGGSSARKQSRDAADLDALRHRAHRLWAARRDLDCPTVFIFDSPDHQDAATEKAFIEWCRNEEPLRIVDFDLRNVEVDGDLGWVHAVYHVRFQRAPEADVEAGDAWEKWYKNKDEWYPVAKTELNNYPEQPSLRDAAAETELRNRFLESFEARRNEYWHRLFELSDPKDHDAVTETMFIESESMFQYLGIKLIWVEVIGERGRVRVAYDHKIADPSLTKLSPRTMTITEKWIVRDGIWYRDLIRS